MYLIESSIIISSPLAISPAWPRALCGVRCAQRVEEAEVGTGDTQRAGVQRRATTSDHDQTFRWYGMNNRDAPSGNRL
jgi:hypothetical protein